jgi:hypothetical protein
MPYDKGTEAKKPMTEILDLETLALLDALEADLDADLDLDAIDADEMLDDEA